MRMMKSKTKTWALLAGLLGCLCFGGGDWLMMYGDPTSIGKLKWLTIGTAAIPQWRYILAMVLAFPGIVLYGSALFAAPNYITDGSGAGWKYEWHIDEDPKDRFHFECRECVYRHIFEEQNLMKLGAMFCHSDVINFGQLPYTDFKRTKTLCQGGDCCDFDFVRHATDAGNGWERSDSV